MNRKSDGIVVSGLVVAVLLVVGLACKGLGVWQAFLTDLDTGRMEAQADMYAQAAIQTQAQAELVRAEGEKAILQQAALAVAADRRLVTFYALSSNVIVIGVLVIVALGVGLIVGLFVGKGGRHVGA